MTGDRVLDRIRAANPAPATAMSDGELFARIIASPGDDRLLQTGTVAPRRRWLRVGTPHMGFLAAWVVVAAAGATVGAMKLGELGLFSKASPTALFKANPASLFPGSPHQVVVPRTVRRVATFAVPKVGRFQYWIALSQKGWLCGAIRLPDGTWADLGNPDKFGLGGPVPGCGGFPWHDVDGFAYEQTQIGAPNREQWRIAYGYAPSTGNPVKIRDTISGATAPIGDGRYFAIVMPLCKGSACNPSRFPGYRLETLDAVGRVLSIDMFDPGK